jgi:hypothetical protein
VGATNGEAVSASGALPSRPQKTRPCPDSTNEGSYGSISPKLAAQRRRESQGRPAKADWRFGFRRKGLFADDGIDFCFVIYEITVATLVVLRRS